MRNLIRKWLGLPQERDWFSWVEREVTTLISDTDRLMRTGCGGECCPKPQKSVPPHCSTAADMQPAHQQSPDSLERDPSEQGST